MQYEISRKTYYKWRNRYIKHGIDGLKDLSTYHEYLDKKLKVLIQSGNSLFPSEAESFSKTIRQIIHDSKWAHMIRNLIALRYETASFSAPNISVYCPGFNSIEGVKVNDTT